MGVHTKLLHSYIKERLSTHQNSSSLPLELQVIFGQENIIVKILWIVVLALCSAISCYQIYDRIDYFLSVPTTTSVRVETDEYVNMRPFYVTNLATDEMTEYWKKLPSRQRTEMFINCANPVRHLLRQSNITNFTQFWLASNVTQTIEEVSIIERTKSSKMFFLEGRLVNKSGDDFLHVSELSTANGLALRISKESPIRTDSIIRVTLRQKKLCRNLQLVTILLEDFMLLRYVVMAPFGTLVKSANTLKLYKFINTAKRPCEPSSERAESCFNRCLRRLYVDNRDIRCRFPFVPEDTQKIECDPSSINSTEEMHKIYEKSRFINQFTSPTIHCKCTRLCIQDTVILNYVLEDIINHDIIIIQYHSSSLPTITFNEEYAYDTIGLLVDVGGNLGLFLGLSLLSIIGLFPLGIAKFIKNITKLFNSKIKLSSEVTERAEMLVLEIVESKIESSTTKSTSLNHSKIISIIIITFLTITSLFMVYDRIMYLRSTPIATFVDVTENFLVYHPNFIMCGEGNKFYFHKSQLAKREKIPVCNIHFLDFIDMKNMSVVTLWDKHIVEEYNLKYSAALTLSGKEDDGSAMNHSDILMPEGRCHEYSHELSPFGGRGGGYIYCFEDKYIPTCHDRLIQLYIRPRGAKIYTILLSERQVTADYFAGIGITTVKLRRVNHSGKPCVKTAEFDQCRSYCYETKINSTITCKLPFMDNVNQSWCNTTTSAKEAYFAYKKIAVTTDILRECNCHPPCDETIFQTTISFLQLSKYITLMGSFPESNLDENFIEVISYGTVALCCDIGNIFGLTLGLSLLTVLYSIPPKGKVVYNLLKK